MDIFLRTLETPQCNLYSYKLPSHMQNHLLLTRFKNSSRVFALDRMQPSMQLVVVVAPVFCTPLITMHKWLDSITTATPCGFRTSVMAKATCFVNRSCTCSRRENISARRASLESPSTLPAHLSACMYNTRDRL